VNGVESPRAKSLYRRAVAAVPRPVKEAMRGAPSLLSPERVLNWFTPEFLKTLTHVQTSEPVAAITFDDGPHPEYTPQVLEILERHGARGTFFIVGESAQRHPEILQRMLQGGHALANHSWDHPSFALISSAERRRQVWACAEALGPLRSGLFRPPYGQQTLRARWDLHRLGQEVCTWSLDSGDWWDSGVQHMRDHLLKRIKPGAILLLHDCLVHNRFPGLEPAQTRPSQTDRRPMLQALNEFLDLAPAHFRFITVPELMAAGKPQRVRWIKHIRPSTRIDHSGASLPG
jgi:peptidoglycan/xylan/chitin deacetylase (PgdA/CDA1 family)